MLDRIVRLFAGLALAAVVLGAAPAGAQQTASLVGTWVLPDAQVLTHIDGRSKIATAQEILVIEHQEGDFFTGRSVWFNHSKSTDLEDLKGMKPGTGAFGPIIGMLGADGRSVQIIETDSPGLFTGRLTDDGSLELSYAQTGRKKSVLFKGVYKRQN